MSKIGKKVKKGLSGVARVAAATITGGASEVALYGANKYVDNMTDSAAGKAAAQAADAQQRADLEQYYGYGSLAEIASAKKKKEEELGQVGQKTTGLASLIGKGTTLG